MGTLTFLGLLTLTRCLHLQHGQSLTLHHFQQLWGHLLMWQVRLQLGRAQAPENKGWTGLPCAGLG